LGATTDEQQLMRRSKNKERRLAVKPKSVSRHAAHATTDNSNEGSSWQASSSQPPLPKARQNADWWPTVGSSSCRSALVC
jgi:hypothetical protein